MKRLTWRMLHVIWMTKNNQWLGFKFKWSWEMFWTRFSLFQALSTLWNNPRIMNIFVRDFFPVWKDSRIMNILVRDSFPVWKDSRIMNILLRDSFPVW